MRNENEIYENLGRFLVQFEELNSYIVAGIRTILWCQGLKNDEVQEIILAKLTADPLREIYQSLCGETLQLVDADRRVLKYLFSEAQLLGKQRNDIVHSSWAVALLAQGEDKIPVGIKEKLHRNKEGVATKRDILKSEEITSLVERTKECSDLFSQLLSCVSFGDSIAGSFTYENNKWKRKQRPVQIIDI